MVLVPDTPLPSVAVAVIVTGVSLGDRGLTNPVASTDATPGLLDDQLTVWLEALVGKTAAVNCNGSSAVVRVPVSRDTVMDVTGIVGSVTVTVHPAVLLLPSVVATVIVTVPGVAPAVTVIEEPVVALSVTIPSVEADHFTVGFAVSGGCTVAR
jgi:hypothetical protein